MTADDNVVIHLDFGVPTVEQRRQWATAALEAYTQAVDGKTLEQYADDPERGQLCPALDDLLADLMHLVGDGRMIGALERALLAWACESGGAE